MVKKGEEAALYVAYGSSLDRRHMERLCPGAVAAWGGEIKDHELAFQGEHKKAFANIIPKAGSSVPCLVWRVSQEHIAALDRHEDVPTLYVKKEVVVELEEVNPAGEPREFPEVTGFAYVMAGERFTNLPCARYFISMETAYRKLGFDLDVLEGAFDRSKVKGLRLV